ncbi:hypothetical protein AGLY_014209 [Aphis glycines]|uniref:Reverse transcriptase zinc-binding domain-containing protein n=1 Tax=Aphis glycines TaxID=307491 RepID=A0A6G0T6H9_APHGL|nr:hypothetical protein AGLY_014209 [Aphis glycines]
MYLACPLSLLAEERSTLYKGTEKAIARETLLRSLQSRWDNSNKGRWIYRLISDITSWFRRRHREVSFHLCQVLTSHGYFNEYLLKYYRRESGECTQCGATPDSAEHAVFACDAWHNWRRETCGYLEVDQLTPDNMIGLMLKRKRKRRGFNTAKERLFELKHPQEENPDRLVLKAWLRRMGRTERTEEKTQTS